MLYITTREDKDVFTAAWALDHDRAADGGLFVPFRLPEFTQQEIFDLKQKTFGQIVAAILNTFFAVRTTGWDVDLCIGRNPSKLVPMNHRMLIAEMWHNPEQQYSYIIKKLHERILRPDCGSVAPAQWVKVVIRIAVLFGIFGEMMRPGINDGTQPVDLAVPAKDFSVPMACWYARKMGLPIGTIILGCDNGSALWDFLRRGELSTASSTVAAQQERFGLEWLIQGTLGCNETKRYLNCCQNKRVYTLDDDAFSGLSQGLFAAVVGQNRIDTIIRSVSKTNAYALDFGAALSYGALQDYRAGNAESRMTLLFSDGP